MKPKNHLASALPLVAASITSLSAAPLYWKTSTAAAWTSATWSTAAGGPYDQSWVAGSDVNFEDNLGTTLTIAGPAAPTDFASITANENVTVTPAGTLGTGGTMAIVDVAGGKTLDFAGQALSTAAGTGFIKNGAGTWIVSNSAAYPGGFTLNAGTIAVGNANAMGSGGALVINGGTIRSNGTAARNLGGKFASITMGGNVTLGDPVNSGALTFSTATSLGAATRTLEVNSAVTHSGVISGGAGAGIVKTGPGMLTLSGTSANTYTGPTTISAGTLNISATNLLPNFSTNGSYSVASGAGLVVGNAVTDGNIASILGTTNFAPGSAFGFDTAAANRSYGTVLANTGQGSLGLIKEGGNTLTLSTANTYTGGTTVNAGTVALSNAAGLGSGTVQVNGSGTVTVNAGLNVTNAVTLKRGTASRAQIILGSGNTGSTWSGNITVDNSNAVNNNFAAIQAGGNSTAVASVVSGNIGYSVLGGAGSLSSQSLVLRTTDRFGKVTGSISLAEGYLQMLDSTKWEFSNTSNTWGTLDINHVGAIATVGATNTLSPSGVVTSTVAGLTGGTLHLNNQAGTTAYDQTIAGLSGNVRVGLLTGAATLTLDTATDQTSSGVISGAISLVKSGGAKQTLTGVNTYTGTTTINGGTLALGTTGTLSEGNLTISNGTLDLRKGTSARSLFIQNDLFLSNATLEIGLNAAADQIDASSATVTGSNTIKLHGSVPTGSYEIIKTQMPLGGTFVLDTSGVIPSGFPTSYSGSIQGGSYVLTVTGAATPPEAYWRGGVSSVWNDASAAPNSNWKSDEAGANEAGQIPGAITNVFFSATNATNTDTTLGADTSINSLSFITGTATVGGANTLTILAESGIGLHVFDGANATLNTGAIVTNSTSLVEAGGTLTVNGGGLGAGTLEVDGILNLNMSVTKAGLQSTTSTGVISRSTPGSSILTISTAANSNYDGALNDGAGTLSLVKAGTVTPTTLTLAGTSDYSGGTTITGGILQVNASTAAGTGPIAINGGQRLGLGAGVTLTNPITLGPNSSPQGNGLLTATGNAVVEGQITITNAASAGGHFVNSNTGGTFDIKGPVTSTVPVTHRSGTITYWGAPGTSYNAFSVAAGTARLGANNGLAVTATVTMGQSGVSTLDLAGFNQTLAGVTRFSPNPFASTIGNSSTTSDSVLTTTGTSVFDGVIANAVSGGTRTTGVTIASGALTLGGVNTYTGNTTIGSGAGLTLADNAQLRFNIGATSNSISGTGSAFIDGDFNINTTVSDASPLTSGSWNLETLGASSTYASTFQVLSGTTPWTTVTGDVWTKTVGTKTYSFDESTGVLTMTSTGGGFDSWIASKGLTGGDAAFGADPDHDGIDNGLEFVLGGEPNPASLNANSVALLPTVAQAGGSLTFSFKRKDLSESGVTLKFQWSTDLSFPSPANDVPVGAVDSTTDTITVDVTEDAPDADTDSIIITIPAAKAVGGRLFGRLSAVQAP